ncbi:hypothetical protein BJ912DRAFT_1042771 [Pholiota molesta]|nr:hypothetical protein BJ912DRAFT_1042771 [Pholiota molesta]
MGRITLSKAVISIWAWVLIGLAISVDKWDTNSYRIKAYSSGKIFGSTLLHAHEASAESNVLERDQTRQNHSDFTLYIHCLKPFEKFTNFFSELVSERRFECYNSFLTFGFRSVLAKYRTVCPNSNTTSTSSLSSAHTRALTEAFAIVKTISIPIDPSSDKAIHLTKTSVGTEFSARWPELLCKLELDALRTVAVEAAKNGWSETLTTVAIKCYARVDKTRLEELPLRVPTGYSAVVDHNDSICDLLRSASELLSSRPDSRSYIDGKPHSQPGIPSTLDGKG